MCKFGINTVSVGVNSQFEYTVEVYKHCLKQIAEHGFKYVEYSHVNHLTETEAWEIGQYASKLDLSSHSVHAEGHILKYGLERFYEIQDTCMKNAKTLGCKIIVFHLPYPEGVPDKTENIGEVKRFAEMAIAHGLCPALENGPVDMILDLINDLNIPELKFVLDTGHAFKDGYLPHEVARKVGSLLGHTHIADNFGITDDHLPPGIGLIDWHSFRVALQEIEYDGVLMVELTGAGMKAKRVIPNLRNLTVDFEMNMAKSTLDILQKNYKELV